jgi:peptidoglycan/LPS O-acetylase OafA/YrhL
MPAPKSTPAAFPAGNSTAIASDFLTFIPELTALRAIAVGVVLLEHTLMEYFPGGFIGVNIFFVLSGWLITTILVHEFERDNAINIRHFYTRRVLRLMPALGALLAVYVLLVFVRSIVKPDDAFVHDHLIAALSASLYVMNWTQAFALGPPGYLEHTWSLGIEEQFYILWPLVLILVLRYFDRAIAWKFVLTLILIVMAWRTLLMFGDASAPRIYFALDTRIDVLLVGCLLALFPFGRFDFAARFVLCPIVISIILTLTLEWTSPFHFFGLPIIAFCSAWLIVAASTGKPDTVFRRVLRWKPLVYCGQISYGFYLWSFPIGIVVAGKVGQQSFGDLKTFLITAVLTLLVASCSYYLIELPFLRMRHDRWRSSKSEIDPGYARGRTHAVFSRKLDQS